MLVTNFVLCYNDVPVVVSSAFKFFCKQFNTYSQCTLVRLRSFIVVMHLVLCDTVVLVAVGSALMFFSKQFNAYS